jgi:serine/threonine-protein kinase
MKEECVEALETMTLKALADQGDAESQNEYGDCLFHGDGIAKDLTEAVRYYKMSADHGNSRGQYRYGLCLEHGHGTPKNLDEAAKYYKLAMRRGNQIAREAYNRLVKSTEKEMMEHLATALNDYKKVMVLGRGGFGIVWLFEDKSSGEKLAVKYVAVDPGSEFKTERFVREVRLLASLDHPNIIKVVDWSLPKQKGEQAFIALEYASNGSIADVLDRIKKGDTPSFWTYGNISNMTVGLVSGMKYLHSRNIIHRDLKPGNLLIDENFQLRICDFGFAFFEQCGTSSQAGTFAYMAPESGERTAVTRKVDVFAFGLILYELLIGESVFPKRGSIAEINKLHKDGWRPEIPNWVNKSITEVITRCWSVNPSSRPDFDEIYDIFTSADFILFDNFPPENICRYDKSHLLMGNCSRGEVLQASLISDFSDYEEIELIGRGRLTSVYLLENKSSGERLAVKHFETNQEIDFEGFLREANIHALMRHPNVIRIIGLSIPNSKCTETRIFMEYASVGSLEDAFRCLLKGDPPMFWTHQMFLSFIVGMVSGMQYIHSKGVIHGNLKPSNLLIGSDFRLRISDCRNMFIEDRGTASQIGTSRYMAPESFGDAQPTNKIDVFAFGLILYELLVGESVFPKDASIAEIFRIHEENRRPEIPDCVSESIASLIRDCWSPKPESRPSFEDIYARLEDANFIFFNDVSPEMVHCCLSEQILSMQIRC